MDDHSITPRRALPPVPPPGRQAGTATLAPATPPTMDHTSWFDPLDPMNDSAVHAAVTGLHPLDDGTAAKAARDLIRESGRQPVLDQALLEALDAAAKAAAARRAVTVAVPVTAETPVVVPPTTVATPAVPAAAPAAPAAPVPPPVAVEPIAEPATAVAPAPEVVEAALDVSAEFARHDDLVETGRHAAVDDEWVYDSTSWPAVTDTGRHLAVDTVDDDGDHDGDHDEDDDHPAPLTHRTVVTRSSSARRWIPLGVGVGVAAVVGAVLLTSGFGADASSTSTDEAARTGTSTSDAATPTATTPALPTPAMNTLDLSGPIVVDTEDTAQDTAPGARTTAAVQPQVATAPTARTTQNAPVAPGGGTTDTGTGTGSTTGTTTSTLTASTASPSTETTQPTVETTPPSSGSGATS